MLILLNHQKKSNKEKYGVEFVSQVPEIRQKAEETLVEKYGVKYKLFNYFSDGKKTGKKKKVLSK